MRWLVAFAVLLGLASVGYAQNGIFSGGDSSSVFLCNSGLVYVSGNNGFGQLGRGVQPNIVNPDIVSGIGGFGTLGNIKQVSGKQDHTLIALSITGDSVITWGSNSNGQLGSGLYGNQIGNNNRFPYRVIGVGGAGYLSGIKYVAMGTRTAYAITNDGKVVSWGSGNNGSLGNGTNGPDMTSPVFVLKAPGDTLKNVISISAGLDFAIALLSDGTVWGWGRNDVGQLGQNNNVSSDFAIQIKGRNGVGFLSNIAIISSSGTHTLALSTHDTLWAWGRNSFGQLGNNSNLDSQSPVVVLNSTATGPLRNVVTIAADKEFSMALRRDSTISVWGSNAFGKFGNNSTISSLIPTKVLNELGSGSLSSIVQISTGNDFAIAHRANGDMLYWGDNRFGQLGLGDVTGRLLPVVLAVPPCIVALPPSLVKGTITGPASVCGSVNSGTVTLAGTNGTIVGWQFSTNNFTTSSFSSSTLNSYSFNNLTQKTSFRAILQFNNQIAYSDSLIVNYSTLSDGGIVSSSAQVCSGSNGATLTLTGYVGSVQTWESSLDSFVTSVIAAPAIVPSYTYSNLTTTTYYRAIVKSGYCPADTSTIVKIKVDSPTFGGILSGATTVCTGTNSGTISLAGENGSVLQWESSTDDFSSDLTPIASTASTLNFLNLTATTSYRVQIKNGNCVAAYSTVAKVNVDGLSNAGTLGASATVCSGSNSNTLTLTGNVGAVIGWETSTDNFITLTPIANFTTTQGYTNLTMTTYYRVLVQNGVCPSVISNSSIITVDAPSVGGTTSAPLTVCFGTNSGSTTLSGNTGSVLQWEFSSDNFSSFINPIVNTTSTQNFTNLTVTTYYRAVVKNGVCPIEYSTVNIITVDPLTSGGSLGSNAVVCSGSNSGTLTLSSYVGTILDWESSIDNFASAGTPISNTTNSQNYSNLTVTTYFRVVLKNGVCPSLSSPVSTITVTPLTVGGSVASSTTICAGASGTLLLVGQTGSVLNWEYSNDLFSSDIHVIANTGNSYFYTSLASTTSFRAYVKNGTCPATYSAFATISVDQPSQAGVLGTSTTVCAAGNSGTLNLGATIVGTVINWESSTDNFSTIVNPITNTTTSQSYLNLSSTTSYRAFVKNGVCPSVASNIVQVTVDAVSSGGIVSGSTNVCSGTNSGSLSVSGYLGTILRWESSLDNFATLPVVIANTTSIENYSNLINTTYYRAVVQNGVCPFVNSASIATVTAYPVTAGGVLNFPATVCYGFNSGTVSLVGNIGQVVHWEKSEDNFATYSTIPSSNLVLTQNYSNLINTTYYRALVQNGVCVSAYSASVTITVNPNSIGGTIAGATSVCTGTNSGTLTISGYLGSVVQWETSTDNFSTVIIPVSNTSDNYSYSNLTTTTYFRAQVQNSGCAITYPPPAVIQVDPVSAGGTLTAPAVVCANGNSGSITLVGENGTILRWEKSLDNFVTDVQAITNTTTIENYLNLVTTTYYRAVVKSGVCPTVYSNNTAVTVNPATTPGTILGTINNCIDGNNGPLILYNNGSSSVIHWETSLDNFATAPTIVSNTTTQFDYLNLTSPLSVRAYVQFAPCPAAYSNTFTIIINPTSQGGYITGSTIVAKGEGSGMLLLNSFVGSISQWEYSVDTTKGWTDTLVTTNVFALPSLDSTMFFRVLVKSGNCLPVYSKVFRIRVDDRTNREVKVYPTLSPNDDNINDEWIIDNITLCPGNQVTIFNRWGDKVYEEHGYDNTSKVWRGQSNSKLTVRGQDLPEGTYFYLIRLGNGKPDLSGYVVLNR